MFSVSTKIYKGQCCGNCFLIVDCRNSVIIDRKSKVYFSLNQIPRYHVDSVLFIESSDYADIRMEIFEQDGSESDSCGNGMLLISHLLRMDRGSIETKGGIVVVAGDSGRISISLSLPEPACLSAELVDEGWIFVQVGEPHLVCLIPSGLEEFDLIGTGKGMQDRYLNGVNVDIVQKIGDRKYRIRTYERGVFNETLSCGTGSLSAYLAISRFNGKIKRVPFEFQSSGGTHWVFEDTGKLYLQTSRGSCGFEIL